MFPSVISTQPLNTCRDGDSITAMGSLFQWFIILSVKKFLQIPKLNFLWCNLSPFHLIPCYLGEENNMHLASGIYILRDYKRENFFYYKMEEELTISNDQLFILVVLVC